MYVCIFVCMYACVCVYIVMYIGICVVEKRGKENESEEAMLLKEREFGRSIGRICIKAVCLYTYIKIYIHVHMCIYMSIAAYVYEKCE